MLKYIECRYTCICFIIGCTYYVQGRSEMQCCLANTQSAALLSSRKVTFPKIFMLAKLPWHRQNNNWKK